jgi:hypothetical protein
MKKTKEQLISLYELVFNNTTDNHQEQFEEAQKICADILLEDAANPFLICMRGIIDFHLGQTKEAEVWM